MNMALIGETYLSVELFSPTGANADISDICRVELPLNAHSDTQRVPAWTYPPVFVLGMFSLIRHTAH